MRLRFAWLPPFEYAHRSAASKAESRDVATLNQEASVPHARYTPAKSHIWKVACATRTTNFIILSRNSKMRGKVPPNCESCYQHLSAATRYMKSFALAASISTR